MSTMSEINLKVNVSYGGSSLNDEANSNTVYLFVLWGVLLPLVAGAGLVGNVLTMLVLWRREMNSTTILYLRGLVITDTGILIGSVITLTPLACANYLQGESSTYFKDSVYPLLHTPGYYIIMSLQQINVWITVSVSVERYISICHPYRAARLISRKKTLAVMVCIAAISVLYNLPHLFASKYAPCTGRSTGGGGEGAVSTDRTLDVSNTTQPRAGHVFGSATAPLQENTDHFLTMLANTAPQTLPPELVPVFSTAQPSVSAPSASSCLQVVTTRFGLSTGYKFYRTIMYLIIIYVLPFLALLVLNTFLIRELMTMQKRNIDASRKEESEANLSLVLILIVIVFIFCQTPGMISQFDVIDISVFVLWLGVSNFLFTTNSAVNFLIYTAFGRKFRLVLLRMFRRISATKDYLRSRASFATNSHAHLTVYTTANGGSLREMSPFFARRKKTSDYAKTMHVENGHANHSNLSSRKSLNSVRTNSSEKSATLCCFRPVASPTCSTRTIPTLQSHQSAETRLGVHARANRCVEKEKASTAENGCPKEAETLVTQTLLPISEEQEKVNR